jgi:hypothetical protein
MTGVQIALDLAKIESRFGVSLGHDARPKSRKTEEYEQFEHDLRAEAAEMSEFYELFYCLENSIRKMVEEIMVEAEGPDWWKSNRVHEEIRKKTEYDRDKEVESGVTPRSDRLIAYTTFGYLSKLITDNWDLFETVFRSQAAVSRVSSQLNLLRGPIAHCSLTDELEQERLNMMVKSWFRMMS